MRPFALFAGGCALALLAQAGVPGVRSTQEPSQQPSQETGHEHSPLEEAMESIKGGVRKLRRSLRKPESDADSLATLASMQAAALAAKSESPRMTASVPGAEQAAFLTAYRKEMITLLQTLLSLETALLDGNREGANAAFDALRGLEDPAHERFIQDE